MNTLFPLEPVYPNGFVYFPSFISPNEEASLLAEIARIKLHPLQFQGYEARRKVASFGYDYSFDNRRLSKGKEIPSAFSWIIKRVADHISIEHTAFAELLITEYPEGAVINWHRDAPPFGTIAGISLRADCVFRLRPYDKSRQKRNAIISLPIEARSLYIMRDEARNEWEHSTRPTNDIRYSITLRTLRS